MNTSRRRFGLVPVLVCLAALLCLAAGCGKEAEVEDEATCAIRIEREIDRLAEAMKYVPIPLDPECQSRECRRSEKRYLAENELLMRVYDEHGDRFWRQRYVKTMGFGRSRQAGDEYIPTGELSIFIYVSKRVPPDVLPMDDLLPDYIGCIRIRIEERPGDNVLLISPSTVYIHRWSCLVWPAGEYCSDRNPFRPADYNVQRWE